jgi:hypothetical protein
VDDGTTTIGWMYINTEYFSYTLEDTFREEKIMHKTRIPKGNYTLGFNEYLTKKTESYQKRFKPWFKYHLHVKNVKGYTGIYIHPGATHEHTSGCLLISDSIVIEDAQTFFNNSRNTYKKLYLELSDYINNGIKVRIVYYDENWINKLN